MALAACGRTTVDEEFLLLIMFFCTIFTLQPTVVCILFWNLKSSSEITLLYFLVFPLTSTSLCSFMFYSIYYPLENVCKSSYMLFTPYHSESKQWVSHVWEIHKLAKFFCMFGVLLLALWNSEVWRWSAAEMSKEDSICITVLWMQKKVTSYW